MTTHQRSDIPDTRYDEVTSTLRDHFRQIGEQWSRIWALAEKPPLEDGETAPGEDAARRAATLLWNLWLHTTPEARRLLKDGTFITRTGYGTYQLEWKKNGRYLEVEVSESGVLEGLAEDSRMSDEFEENDAEYMSRFNEFWAP